MSQYHKVSVRIDSETVMEVSGDTAIFSKNQLIVQCLDDISTTMNKLTS